MQAAAKQTVSERPNKIGMPTPMPSSPAQENAYLDDGDDTNLDGIDDAVAVAAKSAGEQHAGMMRVRGGMGAGASALTVESPDAEIKAAFEARCIGAGAVGVPRPSGRTRKKEASEYRPLRAGGSSVWADAGWCRLRHLRGTPRVGGAGR